MTEPPFKIESASPQLIVVRHEEGHSYWVAFNRDGQLAVKVSHYREAQGAKHSAIFFIEDALKFATQEARDLGFYDDQHADGEDGHVEGVQAAQAPAADDEGRNDYKP